MSSSEYFFQQQSLFVKPLLSGKYLDLGIPLVGYIGSPWLSVLRSSLLFGMLEISLNLTSLIETCFLPIQMVWQFFLFFNFFVSLSLSCSRSAISWIISIICFWIASWSILTVIINKLATLQIKQFPKPNNLQAFFYCEIKWQNSGRGFTELIGLLIQIIDKMESISIDWVKLANKNTTVCNLLVIVLVFWLEAWTREGGRQKIGVDRNS